MARTEIPITTILTTGVANAAGTAGDTVNNMQFGPNDGTVWIEVQNPSTTTALKFTLVIPGEISGFPIAPVEVSVAKEKTEKFGPFPVASFDNKGGMVYINPASAELKFSAYRL